MRMLCPERQKIDGIKSRGRPLAFKRQRALATGGENKIDFMTALISPVSDLARLQASHHFVEHEMFPQDTKIVFPQFLPATVVADEAGVEAIHLGSCHDLRRSVTAERTNHVCNEGGLQHAKVIGNRGPTHLARSGEPRGFKDPATLC